MLKFSSSLQKIKPTKIKTVKKSLFQRLVPLCKDPFWFLKACTINTSWLKTRSIFLCTSQISPPHTNRWPTQLQVLSANLTTSITLKRVRQRGRDGTSENTKSSLLAWKSSDETGKMWRDLYRQEPQHSADLTRKNSLWVSKRGASHWNISSNMSLIKKGQKKIWKI